MAVSGTAKSDSAFRTIGELSDDLGVPQHILRYWETRFPQLRPLQRAGNRRYYRPDDVALVKRIHGLLNRDGYTVKGVQKLLSGKGAGDPASSEPPPHAAEAASHQDVSGLASTLKTVRDRLKQALTADDIAARL
jgi:DNA-binding transcriptional MerR regulator